MLGKVEELMQQPDAPNLYWALTALPHPFMNVRKPMEHELGAFQRSFPQLRDLDKARMTTEQAQKLADDVLAVWVKLVTQDVESPLQEKVQVALTVSALLPEARKELIAQGRKADEVDTMPPGQVVLIWFADRKARGRDETLKVFALPGWQALPALENMDKQRQAALNLAANTAVLTGDMALSLVSSGVLKFYWSSLRTERWIAALRTVEAVRLHAAAHEGKLPNTLKDVDVVPLPLDPQTGEGFDKFYSVAGEGGVLSVPLPHALVRRYILSPVK
jgi:hypothetical protein